MSNEKGVSEVWWRISKYSLRVERLEFAASTPSQLVKKSNAFYSYYPSEKCALEAIEARLNSEIEQHTFKLSTLGNDLAKVQSELERVKGEKP